MANIVKNNAYDTLVDLTGGSNLPSIANGARWVSGVFGADGTGGALLLDLLLGVTFAAAPTPGTVDVFVLRAIDGTHYPYGDTSNTPQATLMKAQLVPNTVTTAQYMGADDVPGPPGAYKVLIVNNTGQAIPSGSTFTARPHSLTDNG